MNSGAAISISSLYGFFIGDSFSFVFFFSKIGIGKRNVNQCGRAIIQLIIVGYILEYVFGQKSPVFTTLLLFL